VERKIANLISLFGIVAFFVGIIIFLQAPNLLRPEPAGILGVAVSIGGLLAIFYPHL